MKLEAIVFDMYGTVANLGAVTKACDELVAEPVAFGGLWRSKQLEYTFLLSLMDNHVDFWQVTEWALHFALEATGSTLSSQEQSLLMQSWLRPEPYADAVAGLQRLKDRYPLAILSNGSPEMLDEGLKYARLETYFDAVISVEEVQVFKPSPRVYGLAPSRLGMEKEKILFVSSNSFDVVGGKRYGLYTCWVQRKKAPLDSLGLGPDWIVGDFEGLVDRLDTLS